MNRQGTYSILLFMTVLLSIPRGLMAGPIRCDLLNELVGNRWEVFAEIGVNLFESSQRPQSCFRGAFAEGPAFICTWETADEQKASAIFDSMVEDIKACLRVGPEGIRALPEFKGVQCMESQMASRKGEAFPVVDIHLSYGNSIQLIMIYFPSTQRAARSAVGYGLLSRLVDQSGLAGDDRVPGGRVPSAESPSSDYGSTATAQPRSADGCDWFTRDLAQRERCRLLRGTVSMCRDSDNYVECYFCDIPPLGPSQGDVTWFLKSDGTCDGVTQE